MIVQLYRLIVYTALGKCDADPRDKETLQLGQASTLVTFDKEPGHSEMLI